MLKAILDSLDGVDEGAKGYYVEQAEGAHKGKFLLQVEAVGGMALEDVNGLKSALGKERSRADAAEKTLNAFDGLDAAKAREALAKVEELGSIDPKKDADRIVEERVRAAVEKITGEHQQQMAAKDKIIEAQGGELDTSARMAAKTAAFDKLGVIPERRPAVDAYLDRYMRTELRDGKRVVSVIDDAGNPRIANDGSTMDVSRFVQELSNDTNWAWAFKGTDKTGGGTQPGSTGGGASKTISRSEFDGITDPMKQADIAKTHTIVD